MFHHLREYFTNQPIALERFKWLGNIATYIAAVAIGISVAASSQSWPFFVYLIGNAIWAVAAIVARDRPLLWMQIFFAGINIYAILLRT